MANKTAARKFVTALNTVSGVVGSVPAHYLDHPVLSENLVEVPEGTKSYDPKFYKGGSAADHKAKDTTGRKGSAQDVPSPDIQATDATNVPSA